VYYTARTAALTKSQEPKDAGCNVRNAFKSLELLGACLEKNWPYPKHNAKETPAEAAKVDARVNEYPGRDNFEDASLFRIQQIVRLDINRPPMDPEKKGANVSTMDQDGQKVLDNLHICLTEEHPVVFGFWYIDGTLKWTTEKWAGETNILAPLPKAHRPVDTGNSKFSGHTVLAVGYDDERKLVLCQDSLKERQLFWMPYNWITDYFATDDFWTLRV
jgi:C1A family cysteine protease